MTEIFFHFSGEAKNLPLEECLAILKNEEIHFKILNNLDQVLIIDSDIEKCTVVIEKAAYTYRLCKLIKKAKINEFSINTELINKLDIKEVKTFSVRIKKIKTPEINIDILKWESDLGKKIKTLSKGMLKVKLKNPDLEFFGLVLGKNFIFGLTQKIIERRKLDLRQGKYNPRFHPGVMHPRIARSMVNLSQVKKTDIFLDPFLGTGGIAIEAGLLGCKIIGIELEKKMIYAAIENLKHYDIDYNIIYGDSKYSYLRTIDSGATDPPYGIATSTHGFNLNNLIDKFLINLEEILRPGKYFTISIPSNIEIKDLLEKTKLKLINSFDLYVHKSLTRRIIVLRR